jgi:PleD family two-component response regulator
MGPGALPPVLTAAMNLADGALYAAKEAGRNRILPVDPAA